MKKDKTFMIEILSEKFNVETLIYLNESEFSKIEKKSCDNNEDIKDTFAKYYIKNKILQKNELMYVKDSHDSKRCKYFIINTSNMSSMSIEVIGYLNEKVNNTKEFSCKLV